MKVLLIEDDPNTSRLIQRFLSDEDFSCDCVTTGEEALQISRVYDYDVIVLDIKLPDVNGHDLLRRLRDSAIKAPILVLSGFQSVRDKVKALGFGADDYMTKPFVSDELIVRLKALQRRSRGHSSSVIKVGAIELDMDTKTITVNGTPMELTGKEYQILEFLLMRKGATVTKGNFLNHLYNGMDEPEQKIIDVFMCKVRGKLEKMIGPVGRQYIETIWGRGYVLREPVSSKTANMDITHDPSSNIISVVKI